MLVATRSVLLLDMLTACYVTIPSINVGLPHTPCSTFPMIAASLISLTTSCLPADQDKPHWAVHLLAVPGGVRVLLLRTYSAHVTRWLPGLCHLRAHH